MRGTVTLSATVLAAAGLAGCGVINRKPDLIAGKTAFVQKCGSCHTLDRAGTKGTQGPNLDDAFRESLGVGIKRSTVRGVVHRQILYPNLRPQQDPVTGKELIAMPAKLVKGGLSEDVAAYVASVAARSGKDQGRLADIGKSTSKGTAKATGGVLDIPTDPSGQLAYQFAAATAPAGAVDIKSVNKASTPHDIAIQGNGADAKGKVVSNGGVSEVKANLKPGTYTFYCTVPGHEQAGMKGKLTVK
jgi:uncharacterized cupredoxin-like copper-binding protein